MSTVEYFEGLRVRPAPACTMAAATTFAVFVCYALLNQPAEQTTEEHATVASPRTSWSSRTANQSRKWSAYQASLVGDANAYESGRSSRLVLFGDSITEAWRGTGYGSPNPRADGVPAVLNETLARQWPPTPLVLAISGDQTQHLLWRIASGEMSKHMARDPQLLISLLIGTNNLGHGHLPEATAQGVLAVARSLLTLTRGKLLVNGLLPRGDGPIILPTLCPQRCNHAGQPYSSFGPPVRKVNAFLAASMPRLEQDFPGRVAYVDCGAPFVRGPRGVGDEEVVVDLMPDRLHPNAQGGRLMAHCIGDALKLLDRRKVAE